VSAGLIFLIVALVCVILFAVVTFAVVVMIKNALSRAADRALNVAQGMAGQAVGRAVEIGAQQLIQGAQTMSEEAKRRDPSWVTVQINRIAHRNKGELTLANVISELSVTSELAESVLAGLVDKKICFAREDARDGVKVFVFPGFKEKREVKFCEYCNSVYMPEDVKDTCVHCGATLKRTTSIV
jgi:hypothetical protein